MEEALAKRLQIACSGGRDTAVDILADRGANMPARRR